MSSPLRIIYAGTPDFAVPALEALIASRHEVIAVYTQPDRPAGRGRKLTPSPVKEVALRHNIPVYQPEKLKGAEAQQELINLKADIMVVAAYGLILPKVILDAPRFGCLNIHASLLPRWRGAAPIHRAILAGDSETGITIMQMDVGLDTGDMLIKHNCPIKADDNSQTLHDRLASMGADALMEAIDSLQAGNLKPEKQDETLVTYAHKLSKDEGNINWHASAAEIERQVRAFNPWPVAQTPYGDGMLRIWDARAENTSTSKPPGTVLRCDKHGIEVATGNGVLKLLQIQLPGKKAMDAQSFANAHSLDGVVF